MRKIAIIQFRDVNIPSYDDYADATVLIATKITDWEEVDDETFKLLFYWQTSGKYRIIEQPTNQSEFIKNSIADYKKYIAKEEEKIKIFKEEKEKKRRQKLLNKQAQTIAEKRKLLEQLKVELEWSGDAA